MLPPGAKLLYSQDSLSLAEIIRLVNKFSSNTMARQLLLTMAAEKAGPARHDRAAGDRSSPTSSRPQGISIPDLVLENGSGLSREERISASGLADVLLAAWRSQYMPEFAASLPLSATDGTLRKRFRSPEMQGRLRMKTGTLEGVSALAGYVNAASRADVRRRHHREPPTARSGGGAGRADRPRAVGVRPVAARRVSSLWSNGGSGPSPVRSLYSARQTTTR